MAGLVTSRSIRDITLNAAYTAPDFRPPDLKNIFNAKAKRASLIAAFQKAQRNGKEPRRSVQDHELSAANHALLNMPQGFRLTKLVYTRVAKEQNKLVYNEFKNKVRPRFLQYLARNHRDELKKMGICYHGIKRMERGIDPADKEGRLYAVSVDHIIERSGGGKLSHEKSVDKRMKTVIDSRYNAPETYEVNHFDNLILLPDHIHFKWKNTVNDIQRLPNETKNNQSVWAMMLIPERTEATGLYAYCPPPEQHQEFKVRKRKMTAFSRLRHCGYLVTLLDDALKEYFESPDIKKTYSLLQQKAADRDLCLKKVFDEGLQSSNKDSKALMELFYSCTLLGRRDDKVRYKRILALANEVQLNMCAAIEDIEKSCSNKKQAEVKKLVQYAEKICEGSLKGMMHSLSRVPARQDGTAAKIILKAQNDYKRLKALSHKPANDNQFTPNKKIAPRPK